MKLRTALYVILIVLINVASTTMFFRLDLTENKSYSLSDSSKALVGNLEEPLTIKVFLSENLPVPYNTLERDIRDILGEYQLKANKHFNYTIDLIKKDVEADVTPETYGIYPVNIQSIEQDEMKVVSAYIGMTFIHGDLTQTVPAIQYNENLEFTITKTIRKMTEKTTALLGMEENIEVKLYISPILKKASEDFVNYKSSMDRVIESLNKDYFNRITLEFIEPADTEIESLINKYNINKLALEDSNGSGIAAVASLIIEGDNGFAKEELITSDIFGRTIIIQPEQLEENIRSSMDKMIGAGTSIGYLISNGTIPMGQQQQMMFQQSQDPQINTLNKIITDSYNMVQVDLTEGSIPEGIKTLIIARPKEAFTERQLYLLDQFVMEGNSLFVALDQFQLNMQMAQYGQEHYMPVSHGLKDFLAHHGIAVEENLVLDENSFKQMQRDNQGSVVENQIYFAPMIQDKNINKEIGFMKGINELITIKGAEVKPLTEGDESVKTLFSSSDKAWHSVEDGMTMDPNRIFPSGEKRQYSLAVLKDSNFTSYFSGKEIPAKEFKTQEEDAEVEADDITGVNEKESLIESSSSGNIMVIGSSEILTDQLVSSNFKSNVMFIQNSLDYMSGRGDYTQMRSKGVFNRPMEETSPVKRNFIKSFNIAGLPILVALAGLLAYFMWTQKKKRIMVIFQGGINEE